MGFVKKLWVILAAVVSVMVLGVGISVALSAEATSPSTTYYGCLREEHSSK